MAIRLIRTRRLFSFVQIIGYALGLASAILILTYVRHELTFDRDHPDADRLFLIQKYRKTSEGLRIVSDTWEPVLPALKAEVPAVEDGFRLWSRTVWVETGSSKFQEEVTYSDPSMLTLLNLPLEKGFPETAMRDKYSIVISAGTAQKYFGSEDPVGKTLTVDFQNQYTITGVFKEIPTNTMIRPSLLATFESSINLDDPQIVQRRWNRSFLFTCIKIRSDADTISLQQGLAGVVKRQFGEQGPNGTNNMTLKPLAISEWHEFDTNSRVINYALACGALAILLIAAINYINIAIARSLERLREIGIRKVHGAGRRDIALQLLTESTLFALLSVVLAAVLSELMLPTVNQWFEIQLSLFAGGGMLYGMAILTAGMVTGLMAGVYPSWLLSGTRMMTALKNHTNNRRSILRDALLLTQFVLSTVLIVTTLVIRDQVEFLKNYSPSFDRDNLLVVPVTTRDFAQREEGERRIAAFRNAALSQSGVLGIASSRDVPGRAFGGHIFATPEGWSSAEPLRIRWTNIDDNFFEVYKAFMIEGRSFDRSRGADAEQSVVLNRSAADAMGWSEALGKTVKVGDNTFNVVGVVENLHTEALHSDVRAQMYFYAPSERSAHQYLTIRTAPGHPAALIDRLATLWSAVDPAREFTYFFVDDEMARLYRSDERLGVIAGYFGGMAILIACGGLFAMVSYTMTRRTKEVGIRKVLGASVGQILSLLTRRMLLLILFANMVAAPVAYMLINEWLLDFAVRVQIGMTPFVVTAFLSLVLAMVTMAFHTVKTGLQNPIVALRYE